MIINHKTIKLSLRGVSYPQGLRDVVVFITPLYSIGVNHGKAKKVAEEKGHV